ncbi:MAG: hypothetical protein B7X35_01220 [Halothiobacillus sp. 14-56-357]|jgi:hypothetical protein|uniref:hypothetical protein n=1 Tax=Halothiobacillus sp. 15-55-196 TaxID=1970382 RepID=UPI000BD9AB7C|nr:hypothetical protein [Halothiobacillus sp. 15-55-196]OZB37235.1 MAG: hypothetical protein B7X44_02300 [Halothiobacillus sp. 15-55-196]OZB57497.1 MAG: hypothetical protein B7X35_01220 [Halothiobacillus sp. 14-56-357]OZB78918.1 MAG: hypothetical protein B7X29_02860 [Halothiobacillus sp. 13-55-115]
MDEELILPIKFEIDPQFERQLRLFLQQAESKMPNVSEAELLRAAAGRREDQRLLAEYAIGMLWLSWRFDRANHMLDSALTVAPAYMSSADYLDLVQNVTLLKNLPLFSVPRHERQTLTDLLQEARLVVYLKTGRLS